MALRRSSRFSKRRGSNAIVIDLTPLIDVTFQLLIFFILTATFQTNPAFNVKLPKAENKEVSEEPKVVAVVVGSAGQFQIDQKVVDVEELRLRLCAAAQKDPSVAINIKADEHTEHQYVVKVMDLAKSCGLTKLGILHNPS